MDLIPKGKENPPFIKTGDYSILQLVQFFDSKNIE